MKKIKNLLTYNIKTLINFELLYKILTLIIFTPLFLSIFQFITKISGYNYLTLENIISFLTNPFILLLIIMLLILLTFYSFIEISTIIVILDSSYQKKKISVKNALLIAIEKSLKVFNRKNILLPFLIIFLIPFLNIGVSSGFISTIAIPEFILDYISANKVLSILYLLLLVLLTILLFRWLYSIHYFVLEDCNFKEARKKSINLSKKNKLKDFLYLILTQFVIIIIYIIFVFILIFLIILFYKLFGKKILSNIIITIIWVIIAISLIIITLLSTPISYAIMSVLFYKHKESKNEKIYHLDVKEKINKKKNKILNSLKIILIVLVLISATLFTYSILNGKYNLNIEYIRTMEVTAHRGASVKYPENTMSAFKGAKELNRDWIELDVQQTKDKKLVVLHDSNLKRTTGVNKNTWELTYDEIEKLDAGSFFSEKFKGEKIPSLEEVIKFAKDNNIKLNIELKPTGKEVDFESSVVQLINKYDFSNNCVVTSQVYEVLENIKKYSKDIETVYVMSLAYGDIVSLKDADNFSIEASSVTKTLVNKVHKEGKQLYAWTVNTKESITNMINLNVDNIITDNITLAKETIYESKTSNVIQEYIKLISNLFN